jgi:hypothetical protein
MDQLVRRILARYYDDQVDYAPDFTSDFNETWMEYIKNKQKPIPLDDNPVPDMLENKDHLDTSFNTTNPYDYESPSDKPKDQKDSPPFKSIPCYPTQFGYFTKPKIFTERGELEDWYKVREMDFTQDEEEQRPALSLTRKYSSCDIIPDPITIQGDDFFEFVLRSKVAASLNEIINKDYHYKRDLKRQRSSQVRAIWVNRNKPNQFEKGLFIFQARTPGSALGPHTVYLQFLRDENKTVNNYGDYPVHIGCTCPSFLYTGAQYYAVQDGYMYMPAFKPDLVAPRSENQYTISYSKRYPRGKKNPGRGLNARVCKHILAVFNILKNTPIKVHYKKYPITSPPSKIINKDVWKNLMKFEFTEENIKQRLLSPHPKVPAYFRRESMTPAVIDWFKEVWFPRTDSQKIKSLREFSLYPERVFFILIEEAYLKRQNNEEISMRLINEGYDMMEKVVQPYNEAKPQVIPENKEYADEGTEAINPPEMELPSEKEKEKEEEKEEEKDKRKRAPKKNKQYGVGMEPKKVKRPDRLIRPEKVKPAIK